MPVLHHSIPCPNLSENFLGLTGDFAIHLHSPDVSDLPARASVYDDSRQTLDELAKNGFRIGKRRHSSVGLERLICNQQVVGSNPTAGSSFFHKDRAKKSLRRGRIRSGSHNLRNSW